MGSQKKFLSLNCKGLASTRKKIALKRVVQVQKLDIIILQETLGTEEEVSRVLSSISSSFTFLAHSAKGHSGGLAIAWNTTMLHCENPWEASFGMGLEIFWEEPNLHLNLINIYGSQYKPLSF